MDILYVMATKKAKNTLLKKSCVLLCHVHIRKRLKDDVAERLPLMQDE